MRTRLAIVSLLSMIAGSLMAQEPVVQLAEEARLDLLAESQVGELRDVRLLRGDGDAKRMNWIKVEDQPRSAIVDFAITPLAWRSFELRFTPQRSGSVALELRSAWKNNAAGVRVKELVLWDALSCDGGQINNGGMEDLAAGVPRGWRVETGAVVKSTARISAANGEHFVSTWHDKPAGTTLAVIAGREVVLRGQARAAFPPGFVEPARAPSRDTPAHRAAKQFLHGINLANHLEAPPEEDWGARHTVDDIRQIHNEGFDHVRIPVGWHYYTGREPEFTIKPAIFRIVDPLVDEALRLGLGVMLNVHHFGDFYENPKRERPKFLAIWNQLAAHYADRSESLVFELLNEPTNNVPDDMLNDVYAETIRAIRQTNPARTLVVGPNHWNSSEKLVELRLPNDDWNLITSVHSYAPSYFSHQGASWSGPDFKFKGIRFPGPPAQPLIIPPRDSTKPYVRDWIEKYNTLPTERNPSSPSAFAETILCIREWSEYYGRPVHLGEFGAIVFADNQSRANYCRAMRTSLESAGIGWAMWDWKAKFRYWDPHRKQPDPGMHEALFGK